MPATPSYAPWLEQAVGGAFQAVDLSTGGTVEERTEARFSQIPCQPCCFVAM